MGLSLLISRKIWLTPTMIMYNVIYVMNPSMPLYARSTQISLLSTAKNFPLPLFKLEVLFHNCTIILKSNLLYRFLKVSQSNMLWLKFNLYVTILNETIYLSNKINLNLSISQSEAYSLHQNEIWGLFTPYPWGRRLRHFHPGIWGLSYS